MISQRASDFIFFMSTINEKLITAFLNMVRNQLFCDRMNICGTNGTHPFEWHLQKFAYKRREMGMISSEACSSIKSYPFLVFLKEDKYCKFTM